MNGKGTSADTGGKLTPYLSPLNAWALAFGCSVGWGAFVMPGTTFLPIAGPVGTAVGMIIGALCMVVIGKNYCYLMGRHADAGGAFTYTKEAFGYDHGFLCAWFLVLAYIAVVWANATALSLVARNLLGNALQFGFHYQIAEYHIWGGEVLVTIIVLLLFGSLVIRGRRLSARLQTVFALILTVGITVIFVSAFHTNAGFSAMEPAFAPGKYPVGQVMRIVVLAPWAYVGFESISHSAGEFKFPMKKAFGIMLGALLCGAAAYSMLSMVAAARLPEGYRSWTAYISYLDGMSGLKALPVFYVVYESLGQSGLVVLGITLLTAIFTGILGNLIAAGRLLYAMALEGMLPPTFARLSKKNTPLFAVVFIMAISMVIPFIGRTAVVWIVDVTTIGATIVYGYTSAAAYKTARDEGDKRMMAAGGFGTVLSSLFALYLLVPNLWSVSTLAPESYLILAVWGILGFILFRVMFEKDSRHRFGKSTVVWLALLFLIFFTSGMWMRQATAKTGQEVFEDVQMHYRQELRGQGIEVDERVMRNEQVYLQGKSKYLEQNLMRNTVLQMVLTVIALGIMFSIYSIMRRRERELEIERVKAEESSQAKSLFLSNMSHEIRTPINAVLGMNEMIIRESEDDRITGYARNVESAGKNLLSIINDILDVSKIEAGRMELVEAPYQLSSVLNDVTNMVSFRAQNKGLSFDILVDERMPDRLYGDEVRVRQVVTNLLTNAVKYTHEGGVIFDVSGERGEEGEITLVCKVIDSGIGIREEDVGHLFEKFERVDLAQNNTIEGTGLGLSITQNLVRMMNGEIGVESVYGKGSTFTVRLPQRVVDEEPIGDFHEKYEHFLKNLSVYHESFRAPDAHVLVVDDTEMNLTVVEGLLEKTQVKLDMVSSGEAALKLTADTPYDLILMDHRMPGMDGTEAMERVRAQPGGANVNTPIIVLTADAVSGARERYLAEGFTDYLSKPINSAMLEQMMRRYLPAEKVEIMSGGAVADTDASPGKSPDLARFYAGEDTLDYDEALRNCGSEKVLAKTLKQFFESIDANSAEIEGYLSDKDLRNYTVKVHALKSSARLIGATVLSEKAAELEECGNDPTEENRLKIDGKTPGLLAVYRSYREVLADYFGDEDKDGDALKEEITADALNAKYDAIREAAEVFDSDAIDAVLEELSAYMIPDSERERLERVKKCARDMDWDGLEEVLK